jgi:WD40 repeat protein
MSRTFTLASWTITTILGLGCGAGQPRITSLAFAASSRELLMTTTDGRLCAAALERGPCRAQIDLGAQGSSTLVVSRTGRLVSAAFYDAIVIVSLDSMAVVRSISSPELFPVADFTTDDQYLVSGGEGSARIHSLSDGSTKYVLHGTQWLTNGNAISLARDSVWKKGLSLSPDGRLVAIADSAKVAVYEWAKVPGEALATFAVRLTPLQFSRSVLFTPDSRELLILKIEEGQSEAYDLKTKVLARSFRSERDGMNCRDQAISRNGALIVLGCSQGSVLVFDAATAAPRRSFSFEQSGLVREIDVSWDGQFVAAVNQQGIVRVWDVASGDPVRTISAADIMSR